MKILIWFGCIFVYSIIVTSLRLFGVYPGGILTVFLAYTLIFLPAKYLCELWDKRNQTSGKNEDVTEEHTEIAKREMIQADDKMEEMPTAEEIPAVEGIPAVEEIPTVEKMPTVAESAVQTLPICEEEYTPDVRQKEVARPPEKKRKKVYALIAVLSVFCIALAITSAVLYSRLSEVTRLQNETLSKYKQTLATYEMIEGKYDDAKNDNHDLLMDNLDLYIHLHKIGYIVNGSNCYHTYDCPVALAEDEYWAHNIEYCEYLGYSKCKVCWKK